MSTVVAPPPDEVEHFVSREPFDPASATRLTPEQERFYLASQWKLMWWKFKLHRVAVVSGIVLLAMYASTLVSEILAPYNLHTRNTDFIYASPQRVHFFHQGSFVGPFVYEQTKTLDMRNLRRVYTEERTQPHPLRFFCAGDPYRFWNLVDASFHLVCPAQGTTLFLLGTDRL
ncbi:MAG TPA: ABC transporter permease, partial [Casimicrobiaceae bacterium]